MCGLAALLPAVAASAAFTAAAQQPVNSATGVALFPGGSVIRSRVETRSLNRDGGVKEVDVYIVPANLSYGATPDLTMGAAIPYVRKNIGLGAAGDTKVDGLADVSLFAKYRYFTHNYPGGTVQLSVLGGVQVPTGETDARGPDGALLPMPDQLGSGSVDFIGALTGTGIVAYDWAIHASVLYQHNTEGDRDFRFGDFVNYNLAASRVVYRQPYPRPEVYLGLELNGEYGAEHEQNRVDVPNSGGNRIFLSPTLAAFLARNWTLEASVQVPIAQSLNGSQPEEDARFVLGFRFQIAPGL